MPPGDPAPIRGPWTITVCKGCGQQVFLTGHAGQCEPADELEIEVVPRFAPIRGRWTTPEGIARAFHEAYESLAPGFGYQTRRESAVPWEDVPGANKALMIATIRNVFIEQGLSLRPPVPDEAAIERGAKALVAIAARWGLGEWQLSGARELFEESLRAALEAPEKP